MEIDLHLEWRLKNSHADYETLLELDNEVPIHQRNLQYLMIEIYKTNNNLNPSFMSEIFEARDVQYDLRNKNSLGIPNARTTSYGIETRRYLGQNCGKHYLTELERPNH